jgi:hypothetical protein
MLFFYCFINITLKLIKLLTFETPTLPLIKPKDNLDNIANQKLFENPKRVHVINVPKQPTIKTFLLPILSDKKPQNGLFLNFYLRTKKLGKIIT